MNDSFRGLAVIGDRHTIRPFAALGFAVFETGDDRMAEDALARFAHDGYPVIFVADGLLDRIYETASKLSYETGAAITALPDSNGRAPRAEDRLNEQVCRAIGIRMAP